MRTWLILLVTAVAVPLVLFSVALLVRNVAAQTEQTERQVSNWVRLVAEDLDREMARLVAALEVLATTESLAKDDFSAFYRQAVEVRDRLGANVVLRDLSNQQLVNSRLPWGTALPVNAGFDVDRRAIETRRPQVSGLITSGVARPPLVFVVTPVIRNGDVRFLLSLTIARERLQALVSPDHIPQGWVVGVVDGDGLIIARSQRGEEFVGTRVPENIWDRIRQVPNGIQRATSLDGVMTLQALARSQTSGWVVGASVPEELVAAPARQALLLFIGGGTALLLIGVGAAIMLGRRLTHPIGQLVQAAAELGAGGPVSALQGGVAEIDAVSGAIQQAAALIQRRTAALAESEGRYRAIVETAADAMVVIDDTGMIQSLNPAAERVFGYTTEEAVGQNVRMLAPEPYRSAHDGFLANYLRTGERKVIGIGREVTGQRKDGSTFPVELSVTKWISDGRRHFTGTLRDITERKRTEAALRASKAEADRANIAKSKFLAAASHDLRQPVQAMMLFQAALEARLADHPAAHLLHSMGESMGGLRMLLDSLLDVSKLDAGLIVPQPTDLPLGPLLARLGAEYHLRARAKGLRLRCLGTQVVVRSDPTLLERIMRNLIENALRYTERGGVLIGCRRQGGRLRIEVVDTGIGIEPDRQIEIFEEFVQVDNPERDHTKGLGLGLAVVRRLSRLLDHEITVRSTPAKGSAFGVEVPVVAHRTSHPVQPPSLQAGDSRRGLILVIDDEPLVRMGLHAMLEGWGYWVLTAGSVAEAVSHVEGGAWPSAILADYRLRGGETGLDAIRAVYERLNTSVPATVITGDTAPERLIEVSAGGYALLHKPIAANELRNAVLEMLPAAD